MCNNVKILIQSVCYSTRSSTQQLQLLHALLMMKALASSSSSSGGPTLRPPLPFEYLRVSDKEVRCHQAQVAKVHLSTPKSDQSRKRGRWRISRFPSLRVELFGHHPDAKKQHVHAPARFMHVCTLGVLSDSVDILPPSTLPRHCKDARVYEHTTTAMHGMGNPPHGHTTTAMPDISTLPPETF